MAFGSADSAEPSPVAVVTQPPGGSASAEAVEVTRRRRLPPAVLVDVLIAAAVTVTTFFVHDVGYILRFPYWLDESWVAMSTRLPLRSAEHLSASTPVGWTILLRTAFIGGDQRQRIIPLVFAALAVLMAYLFAHSLSWPTHQARWTAGALAGMAVLLAPSSLIRSDLKQYTSDAFMTLLLIYLLSRLEQSWSRARVATLCAACLFGFLISAADLFVSAAVLGALVVILLARRQWHRLFELLAFGAVAALLMGLAFEVLYKPNLDSVLSNYWRAYYLPLDDGVHGVLHYLGLRGPQMADYLGMGPEWLALLLIAAGVVTTVRMGRPAVGLALPLLLLEMIGLGAAKQYPLFDERTSHFLTVAFAAYAAIGVAGLCSLVSRRTVTLGLALAVATATGFVVNINSYVRIHQIPFEDVRTPVAYVVAHRQPKDIIIVSTYGNYGFGYYWPLGTPSWHPNKQIAMGYQVSMPGQPEIIFAKDRTLPEVRKAMNAGLAAAAKSPGARIWLVRQHVTSLESSFWKQVLAKSRLQIDPVYACTLLLLSAASPGTDRSVGDTPSASC
jgi:hypothetical protein